MAVLTSSELIWKFLIKVTARFVKVFENFLSLLKERTMCGRELLEELIFFFKYNNNQRSDLPVHLLSSGSSCH